MNYDWDNAREISIRQIEIYGKAGTIVKKGSTGGFDNEGNITSDIPDVIINGTITSMVDYNPQEIDGSSIQAGDTWVYFDSVTEPEIGMLTTINNLTFRILGTPKLISPDGVVVWQRLQLRK